MYRLRTLGQVDLRDGEGHEVAAVLAQPKRLALLAWLAITATGGLQRRDVLLALFWPELTEARARNALRQALHQLRRALGDDVVVSRGADMLGVDGSRLWCDAHAFEDALARGAPDEALAAYGGDLLPGFAVDGTAEFDRWVDETRAALRRRAARAAWAVADREERAGDLAAAVEAARRATMLDDGDAHGAARLAALLRRSGSAHGRAAPSVARPGAAPVRVAVVPFENLSGDPGADFIGRLVAWAIAQGLLESRSVEVVTAERAGDDLEAGLVVDGTYFLSGDAWCFQARVGEPGGRVLDITQAVPAQRAQPWEAADELRRRVSGLLAGRLDPRFASWANAVAQAPDADAHRELARGAELHLNGDYRAALPHFLRASAAREGFVLPVLWAIQASCNLEEWEQAEGMLAELADRGRRGGLSEFERLGCEYYAACLAGQRGAALRIARRAAELLPDTEVLSQLGREALFCNQPRLAVEALERLNPGRGWIPSWTPHWRRLTEAYHMLGDHARELDAARRGRAHHPGAASALLFEARAHAALADVAALERCVDEACALPADAFADAGTVMLDAARELRAHGRPGEGAAFARRAIAWYEEGRREAQDRRQLACAYYEAGRWAEAGAVVRELAATADDDVELTGLAGTIAARAGDAAAARAAIARLHAKTGRYRFGAQYLWIARTLAILGEPDAALAALRGAFARGQRYGLWLHADADLALLGAQPSFRELLRPADQAAR